MKKNIILLLILLLTGILIISNINTKKENIQTNEIKETKNKKKKKKINNEIDFKQFQNYLKKEKVYTFAITDSNSNIFLKFTELINTMSTNNNEKIYILKIDKLSKKEKAKYYNIAKELSSLESNFIIKTYDNKIIQITTFDKDNIDKLIESYKKE